MRGDEVGLPLIVLLALDVGVVELDVGESRRLRARAPVADQCRIAVESNDVTGPSRQEQREPSPAAAEVEDALAPEILPARRARNRGLMPVGGVTFIERPAGASPPREA